ncbi:uncharacterized protein [Nicotiana tomentosiformis]|uniref:uncharacterized protein n=1 Tax=Nicotiana tomentosiformis TaxID=4098 RepID=UPI00388C38A7
MVVDAFSRKAMSMGSLTYITVSKRQLASDVRVLANQFVRLDVSESSHVLACTFSRSSLYERIRERQYDDPHLLVLKDTLQQSDAKQVTIGDDGVLRMQGRTCVFNVDGHRGPAAFRLTGTGPPQPDNTDALQQAGWKLAELA